MTSPSSRRTIAESQPFQTPRPAPESAHKPASNRTKPARSCSQRLRQARQACYSLLRKTIVHVAPIAITIGTLTLTFRQVFWTIPTEDTNTILNLLQFAAQFHGALIVASLSAILLHVLAVRLRGTYGVPVGVITSSYQLNSLTYLFRSEFWRSSTRSNDRFYVALYLCAFALAFACQPSSAIAMIPRLQYWPVRDIYPQNSIQYRAYIQATPDNLYPRVLKASNVPFECTQANASNISHCPSGGIKTVLGDDELFSMTANSAQPSLNLTVDSGWRRQIIGRDSGVNLGIQSSYQARTLSNFLGLALSRFRLTLSTAPIPNTNVLTIQRSSSDMIARYNLHFRSDGRTIPTQRPSVRTECIGYPFDTGAIVFPKDKLAEPSGWTLSLDSDLLNFSVDPDPDSVNFSWIDMSQLTDQSQSTDQASLFAVFATPTIYDAGTVFLNDTSQRDYNFAFYGCTIQAQWESTNVFFDDSESAQSLVDTDPNNDNSDATSNPILILHDFAEALSVPFLDGSLNPVSTNKSIMQAIVEKCVLKSSIINETALGVPFPDGESHRVVEDPMQMTHCFQVALSAYVVDALSRVQDSVPAYMVTSGRAVDLDKESIFKVVDLYEEDVNVFLREGISGLSQVDFDDTSRFVEIAMPMSRYGYGYGFTDSRLIYFAVVILFIHVAVCIAHVIWVALTNDGFHGWTGLGELVALLLRYSDADQGVPLLEQRPNWRDRVAVQKMEEEDRLRLESTLEPADMKRVNREKSTLVLKRIPNVSSKS